MSKTGRKNITTKLKVLPPKYKPQFLRGIDRRSSLYQALATSRKDIISDLGGVEGLSHFQMGLVNRYLFTEFALSNLERLMLKKPSNMLRLQQRWIKMVDVQVRITKKLGIERKQRNAPRLAPYIVEQDTKKKDRA